MTDNTADIPKLAANVSRGLNEIRPWIWGLLVAVLTLAVYMPALSGEFVWDDILLIERSESVRTIEAPSKYLTKSFWRSNELDPSANTYFRPLIALSYAVDYKLHGLTSAGYRATNFLFHALNAALLFRLLRRCGANSRTAASLSLTWALLPRLTECVAWISGRTDIFATSALLAAFILWGKTATRFALATACLVLALLCKETAVVGLVGLLILEIYGCKGPRVRRWTRMSILIIAVAGWVTLRAFATKALTTSAEPMSLANRMLTALEAVGRYVVMLLDWLRPGVQSGVVGQHDLFYLVIGSAAVPTLLLALWRSWRKTVYWTKVALAVSFAALLLVIHLLPLSSENVASNRFLYVPLAFLSVAIASAPTLRSLRYLPLTALAVSLISIPFTIKRAKAWTDPVALWSAEWQKGPAPSRMAQIEIANLEMQAGDYRKACNIYEELLHKAESDPITLIVPLNYTICSANLGEFDRAKHFLRNLIHTRPNVPRFWLQLANIELATYSFEEASHSIAKARKLMPKYKAAEEFAERLPKLIELRPEMTKFSTPLAIRAKLFTAYGRTADAESLWLMLLRSNPTKAEALESLCFIAQYGSSAAVFEALTERLGGDSDSDELRIILAQRHNLHTRLDKLMLPFTANSR